MGNAKARVPQVSGFGTWGTLDWYKIKRSSTQLRYLPFNPSASTTLSSTFVGWPSSFHTTPKPPR